MSLKATMKLPTIKAIRAYSMGGAAAKTHGQGGSDYYSAQGSLDHQPYCHPDEPIRASGQQLSQVWRL